MNISIGLDDQKHFINKYQEPCDAPQKLNHAENECCQQVELILRKTENGCSKTRR